MDTLYAFTPDQACRVTGLSRRQLRYWDATGFFRPQYADDERPRFGRMYSFRDIVALRTIARLRDALPLQELRRVGAWLHARYDEPWATLRFFVVDQQVVFEDAEGHTAVAGTDQSVMAIYLSEMERDARHAADDLLRRDTAQIGRIVRNRGVQHNAWVIDGTRIPTSAIWDFHSAGFNTAAIMREYPRLTPADIHAAIDWEQQQAAKAG